MTPGTSLNASLNEWLSNLAAGRKDVLRRAASRFASLVSPLGEFEAAYHAHHMEKATDLSGVRLTIASGLHRGAFTELTAKEYLIGSGDDCDIVLRDAQVSASHCRVVRGPFGFSVQDLRTGEPQTAPPGLVTYQRGAIKASYDVGGVLFTLRQPLPERAQSVSEIARKRLTPPALLGVLLVCILTGALVTLGAAGRSRQEASVLAAIANPNIAGNRALAVSELVEAAQRALAGENLHVGMIDGQLRVEGTTSRVELKERISALARDLRSTVPVQDRVAYVDAMDLATSLGPLPVRVSAVMAGDPSYFLTDDGTHYFVGGVLPGGAEVLAIDAAQIQFRVGHRVVVYQLK
jgi:Inner membrane component of T3SS, cytoplasmic domain